MSRNVWLVAVFGFAVGVAADSLPSGGAGGAIAAELGAGDTALARFDLEAATAAYREVKQLIPENYEATWKLCRSLIDKGTLAKDRAAQKPLFVEAEQLARTAVQLAPQDSKGHVYLAVAVGKLALFEGGKRKVELSKEVKTEAEKAIARNRQEDVAYHVLGVWNREMTQLNFVLRAFAQLLYGRFPPASLGTAEKHLRQATDLAPHVVSHRVELGRTLLAAGKRAEARTCFEAALKMPKTWVTDDYYKAIAKRNL